ncbi:unnamed protein product, partial [Chrysoparadoxa australica]
MLAAVAGLGVLLGVCWILLMPAVTITTGEAKPRGTYFDENALLVYHSQGQVSE